MSTTAASTQIEEVASRQRYIDETELPAVAKRIQELEAALEAAYRQRQGLYAEIRLLQETAARLELEQLHKKQRAAIARMKATTRSAVAEMEEDGEYCVVRVSNAEGRRDDEEVLREPKETSPQPVAAVPASSSSAPYLTHEAEEEDEEALRNPLGGCGVGSVSRGGSATRAQPLLLRRATSDLPTPNEGPLPAPVPLTPVPLTAAAAALRATPVGRVTHIDVFEALQQEEGEPDLLADEARSEDSAAREVAALRCADDSSSSSSSSSSGRGDGSRRRRSWHAADEEVDETIDTVGSKDDVSPIPQVGDHSLVSENFLPGDYIDDETRRYANREEKCLDDLFREAEEDRGNKEDMKKRKTMRQQQEDPHSPQYVEGEVAINRFVHAVRAEERGEEEGGYPAGRPSSSSQRGRLSGSAADLQRPSDLHASRHSTSLPSLDGSSHGKTKEPQDETDNNNNNTTNNTIKDGDGDIDVEVEQEDEEDDGGRVSSDFDVNYKRLVKRFGAYLNQGEAGYLAMWERLGGTKQWESRIRPWELSLLLSKEKTDILEFRLGPPSEMRGGIPDRSVEITDEGEVVGFFTHFLSRLPRLQYVGLFYAPFCPFDWGALDEVEEPYEALKVLNLRWSRVRGVDLVKAVETFPRLNIGSLRATNAMVDYGHYENFGTLSRECKRKLMMY